MERYETKSPEPAIKVAAIALVVFLLTMLACGLEKACGQEIDWPYHCVVDVVSKTPEYINGQRNFPGGSATYLAKSGGKAVLVSCAHTFEAGTKRGATVTFVDGFESHADIVGIDFKRDISILMCEAPPAEIKTPRGYRSAGNGPFVGVGFPWYGKNKQHFLVGDSINWSGSEINVTCEFHSGYSGGALFDSEGYLCGVILGNRQTPGSPQRRNQREEDWCGRALSGKAFTSFVGKWVEGQP